MARPRSDTLPKEPHSVSLKVLRLSRPLLAQAHPLPYNTIPSDDFTIPISSSASLAYPYSRDTSFVLSPNLSLPSSFGSAHVGETFSCSLCANNELRPPPADSSTPPSRVASNISIVAEIQSPSASFPLQLYHQDDPTRDGNDDDGDDGDDDDDDGKDKGNDPTSIPGSTLQRIIHFDLKEEGTHVLAVNVSYTETTTTSPPLHTSHEASTRDTTNTSTTTTRNRSFRKLYQFQATPLLSVRTKATELPPIRNTPPLPLPFLRRYALEAQLENVSDSSAITLSRADMIAQAPFIAKSANPFSVASAVTVLQPRDVHQLLFILSTQQAAQNSPPVPGITPTTTTTTATNTAAAPTTTIDGRTILGHLRIEWRGAMGVKGRLTTGALMTRKR